MKLNLRLYTVAVLLASIFITLEPYQALGWTQRTEAEANAKREFNKTTLKLLKDSHVVVDVNLMNLLQENKATIAQVEQALELLDRISSRSGNSVSIEITTNAPVGYPTGTPPGTPVTILPTYDINDTIPIGSTNFILTSTTPTTEQMVIAPKLMVPACMTVIICIVVAGFFIYLVYKICKGTQKLFDTYTNRLEYAEEMNTSNIPTNYPSDGAVVTARIESSSTFSRTDLGSVYDIFTALPPLQDVGFSPTYLYTCTNSDDQPISIVVQSKETLTSPWQSDYIITFLPNNSMSCTNLSGRALSMSVTNDNYTGMFKVIESTNPSMFYRIRTYSP